MNGPSLAELERSGCAQVEDERLRVRVPADWPADGENRIGYVSILRLVEATRELHWRTDVAPHADSTRLDSITKSVTAEFLSPVIADTEITCAYTLSWVGSRSYGLRVTLAGERGDQLAAVELASVFIDPGTLRAVASEPPVTGKLRERAGEHQGPQGAPGRNQNHH